MSDRFVTTSVNMMKNGPLIAKKHKQISIYINLVQPHQKTMQKFYQETTTLKTLVSHTALWETVEKLDDLEKYWTNAANNL